MILMFNYEYLSKEQIEVLFKCYYMRKYSAVAEAENTTVGKVKQIKEKALRAIRLAYSKSRMKGLRFNGGAMAERAGMSTEALTAIFDGYMRVGLVSENAKYWERIRSKGKVPTAAELLDFIYDKFEIDIEGGI